MSMKRSGRSIPPSTEDVWQRLIQHPSSALLTHVSRPVFGAPVQPGTEGSNPFSVKDNINTLIPFILVAFHQSVQLGKSSFMNLCTSITNLLQTSNEFNNPDAWYLVLEQLRMPLITNTSHTFLGGPPLSQANPNYPKLLFKFYCKKIDYGSRSLTLYPAADILKGWQSKITTLLTLGEYERFTEAVTSWAWVINNYAPFNAQIEFFTDFVAALVDQSSVTRWNFFVKTVWKDVNVKFDNFNAAIVSKLLERRDKAMETMETMEANALVSTDTKSIDFLLLNVPLDKAANVLVALVVKMMLMHYRQVYIREQEIDIDDISLFYKRLLKPTLARLKNLNTPDQYYKFLYFTGYNFLKDVTYRLAVAANFKILNVYVLNVRLFLTSVFEDGFDYFLLFESYMDTDYQHEDNVKLMRNILTGDLKTFPAYLLPWPVRLHTDIFSF